MALKWYTASAPASARLMGEHAVLRGGPALSFALSPRITVKVRQAPPDTISISSQFGLESFPLSSRNIETDHRFIKAALLVCREYISKGLEINVKSSIAPTVGIGSSAAVTVATIGAILKYATGRIDKEKCLRLAQTAIRVIQGAGSGADAASSIYGGVISFYANECKVQKLADTLPLYLAYSGMKTPTADVIAYVRAIEQKDPHAITLIFEKIDAITVQAIAAIQKGDLPLLGALMNQAQIQMEALGLNNEALKIKKSCFAKDPRILGAKISGSGLGDCLVLLAPNLSKESRRLCLSAQPSAQGVQDE